MTENLAAAAAAAAAAPAAAVQHALSAQLENESAAPNLH
jgi:hypothetical protein